MLSRLAGPGNVERERLFLCMAFALATGLASFDLIGGPHPLLIGLYSGAPLLACLQARPGRVALVSLYALGLAVISGGSTGTFGTSEQLSRLVVVGLAGTFGVAMSMLRERTATAAQAARAEYRRSAFLADAGALLDSSIDYQERLESIARLAVPRMADWAIVEILQEDGSIERLAMAHADPSKEVLLREYDRRYPADPQAPHGSARVIRSGRPELMAEIPQSMAHAIGRDPERLRILHGLGFESCVVVPLRAGGQTLGALTLVRAGSEGRYDDDDLAMIQELATRCALSIENSRLYNEARAGEERFRRLVEVVEDYAIFMLEPDGRVATWNAGAQRFKGYRAEEIIGCHSAVFYTPEDVVAGKPDRELAIAARDGRYEEEAGWRVRKDGTRFLAHVVITALRDDDGSLRGFSKVTRDITERQALEERLRYQALHDPLTSLPNRALFLDRLSHALARADRRTGSPVLLFLDIDRFKEVNDTFGHGVGDALLAGMAARLSEAVRAEDTVGRMGGDEFTVLCEEVAGPDQAVVIAERICKALSPPFRLAGRVVPVHASIGMVFSRGPGETPDSLLRDADLAMYEAKRAGLGRYVIFDESMRTPGPASPASAQPGGAPGSSSNTLPAISTSSPGSNPAASRARMTPIARRRSSR